MQELAHRELRAATVTQRALWDPTPLWQFLCLAKRGRYNIIQSHGYKSHFVACFVSRIIRVPWVAFAHGWTQEDRKVSFYHSLDTRMLRCADSVVAVSPGLWGIFSALRGEGRSTELVLNAVDPDKLKGGMGGRAIRNQHVNAPTQLLIGCFGRLSHEKGQDVLLHALAKVLRSNLMVSAIVLGDGPERESLQRLSDELGIGDRVSFHRHSSVMRDYYEAIDLLVLPSRSEGLPNVVLEALGCGVPVVATDVGAVSEVVIHGKTGWIVPAEDAEALSGAILEALSDPRKREEFSRAGRHAVLEGFSPAARGEKILHVYRRLINSE